MTRTASHFWPRCMQGLMVVTITAALFALQRPQPAWYTVTMAALIIICLGLFIACDPDPPTQEDIDGYLGIARRQPKAIQPKLT